MTCIGKQMLKWSANNSNDNGSRHTDYKYEKEGFFKVQDTKPSYEVKDAYKVTSLDTSGMYKETCLDSSGKYK